MDIKEAIITIVGVACVLLLMLIASGVMAGECYDDAGTRYQVPEGKKFVFMDEHVDAQWCLIGEGIMHPEPTPETREIDGNCDEDELGFSGGPRDIDCICQERTLVVSPSYAPPECLNYPY